MRLLALQAAALVPRAATTLQSAVTRSPGPRDLQEGRDQSPAPVFTSPRILAKSGCFSQKLPTTATQNLLLCEGS